MSDRAPLNDRDAEQEQEHQGPTVRDRRRIDPVTYQVREPQATAAPGPGPGVGDTETVKEAEETVPHATETPESTEASEISELKTALAERTSDLQRLQAEYINYKRRVDRDKLVSRTSALEGVWKDLLPVLDDLRSAREHQELSGGFKAVADEVERVAGKYGLETFGQQGDPFDPHIHEALLHALASGIDGPTCVEILQPGYRIGEKVLRPARVAVAEPGPEASEVVDVIEPEEASPPTEASTDDQVQ